MLTEKSMIHETLRMNKTSFKLKKIDSKWHFFVFWAENAVYLCKYTSEINTNVLKNEMQYNFTCKSKQSITFMPP